jgi:hypothetical protein
VQEVIGEHKSGKSRVSGLVVKNTNSGWDIMGVVVRKIITEGDNVELNEKLLIQFWD